MEKRVSYQYLPCHLLLYSNDTINQTNLKSIQSESIKKYIWNPKSQCNSNYIAKLTLHISSESTDIVVSRFPELNGKEGFISVLTMFLRNTDLHLLLYSNDTINETNLKSIQSELIKKYIWNDKHVELERKVTWRWETEEQGTQRVLIVNLTINQSSGKNGSNRRGNMRGGGGATV
jgi:hypothetical protein